MKKKQYISPSTVVSEMDSSVMICGSGQDSETLDHNSGEQPSPGDDDNIYGESRSFDTWEFAW